VKKFIVRFRPSSHVDKELRREILQHIATVTFNVQSFDELGRGGSSGTYFVTKEHGGTTEVILTGEYYEEYDDLLKLLLDNAGWGEKVSHLYLDSHLKSTIAKIREENWAQEVSDLTPYLDELIADVDRILAMQTAYMPLLGIRIDSFAFPVGNFTLRRYTTGFADELVEKALGNLFLPDDTKEVQETKIKSFRQKLDSFKNTIVAEREFDHPIEASRALEIAEEEIRRVIDLFRYVIASMYPNYGIEHRFHIGLQGEIRFDTRTTFTFSNAGVQDNKQMLGLIRPFCLSTHYDHDEMERIGFFSMSDVLGKSPAELTNYQEALIRGLRLFSDSQTQVERESEFLGMFNCIENFVAPGERLRDNISKTIAFLIANTPAEREQKRIEFQKKYDTRSKITHGSRHIVILDDDLKALRKAALNVICWMIHHDEKFATTVELRRWLKKERLKIWRDTADA
jgi:hypothetical protein